MSDVLVIEQVLGYVAEIELPDGRRRRVWRPTKRWAINAGVHRLRRATTPH